MTDAGDKIGAVTFGAAPPQPPRESPRPEQIRVLWRVERRRDFKVQIITAAIYRHPLPNACELRVFIEPEERNDLLHSELARIDFTPL